MAKAIKVSDELYAYLDYIINRDFGNVSVSQGLYHIIRKYEGKPPQKGGRYLTRKGFFG